MEVLGISSVQMVQQTVLGNTLPLSLGELPEREGVRIWTLSLLPGHEVRSGSI